MPHFLSIFIAFIFILSPSFALAGEEEDMAEMQKQLNAEVMAQPFDAADAAKVDAYIKEAMKNNIKPQGKAPSYWQPGYTCDYIRQYRYRYRAYRNCMYHYRYYGRYW